MLEKIWCGGIVEHYPRSSKANELMIGRGESISVWHAYKAFPILDGTPM